jgi:hypothetical protein
MKNDLSCIRDYGNNLRMDCENKTYNRIDLVLSHLLDDVGLFALFNMFWDFNLRGNLDQYLQNEKIWAKR